MIPDCHALKTKPQRFILRISTQSFEVNKTIQLLKSPNVIYKNKGKRTYTHFSIDVILKEPPSLRLDVLALFSHKHTVSFWQMSCWMTAQSLIPYTISAVYCIILTGALTYNLIFIKPYMYNTSPLVFIKSNWYENALEYVILHSNNKKWRQINSDRYNYHCYAKYSY